MIVIRVNNKDYLVEKPDITISSFASRTKHVSVSGYLVDSSYERIVQLEMELSSDGAAVVVLGAYRFSVKEYTVSRSENGRAYFSVRGYAVRPIEEKQPVRSPVGTSFTITGIFGGK